MIPPPDTATAPLVRLDCQRVVVVGREAEHLLAAVTVSCRDDPAHLVCPRIAAVDHVLERDAGCDRIRPRQVTRKVRAEVENFLGLPVARYDLRAETKAAPLEMKVDDVES